MSPHTPRPKYKTTLAPVFFYLLFILKYSECAVCFSHLHIQKLTIHSVCSDSGVCGTDHQNQSKAQSQEAGSQQVTQCCEVGDGEVIRV